jgi:uncharacterized protein (TIGR03083 family)
VAQSRTEVVAGTFLELSAFEALIRSLSPSEWSAPTRCAGWSVADVCYHAVGTISDIGSGRLAELVGPSSPSERQVAERKGKTAEQIADELRDMSKIVADIAGGFDDAAWAGPPPIEMPGTLGFAVEGVWYDTYIHAEDVRAAIGRPSERGPGLQASVSHLSELLTFKGWGPASLSLDGIGPFAVGDGSGQVVSGDALAFVLAATGRADPSTVGLDGGVNVYA